MTYDQVELLVEVAGFVILLSEYPLLVWLVRREFR